MYLYAHLPLTKWVMTSLTNPDLPPVVVLQKDPLMKLIPKVKPILGYEKSRQVLQDESI